jgi:hypothetical protein
MGFPFTRCIAKVVPCFFVANLYPRVVLMFQGKANHVFHENIPLRLCSNLEPIRGEIASEPNRLWESAVYYGFRPEEWRCDTHRQATSYRRISGRAKWTRSIHTKNINPYRLPLTFSIQIGAANADRFGRVQYSPRSEDLNQDADLHVELNIAKEDFDDLWTRDLTRIPQQFFFQVEELHDDVWVLDEGHDASLLITPMGLRRLVA